MIRRVELQDAKAIGTEIGLFIGGATPEQEKRIALQKDILIQTAKGV